MHNCPGKERLWAAQALAQIASFSFRDGSGLVYTASSLAHKSLEPRPSSLTTAAMFACLVGTKQQAFQSYLDKVISYCRDCLTPPPALVHPPSSSSVRPSPLDFYARVLLSDETSMLSLVDVLVHCGRELELKWAEGLDTLFAALREWLEEGSKGLANDARKTSAQGLVCCACLYLLGLRACAWKIT